MMRHFSLFFMDMFLSRTKNHWCVGMWRTLEISYNDLRVDVVGILLFSTCQIRNYYYDSYNKT